jgi:hypothetical protein
MAVKIKRMLGRALVYFAGALALFYAGDWGVLEVRIAHQTAFSTVQVDQFLASPLKNSKEEYDYMGTVAQPCVRSIFPHAADVPCWWLKRHTTQWE